MRKQNSALANLIINYENYFYIKIIDPRIPEIYIERTNLKNIYIYYVDRKLYDFIFLFNKSNKFYRLIINYKIKCKTIKIKTYQMWIILIRWLSTSHKPIVAIKIKDITIRLTTLSRPHQPSQYLTTSLLGAGMGFLNSRHTP